MTMYEAPNGACNPGFDKTYGTEKGGPWDESGLLVTPPCPNVGLALLRRPGVVCPAQVPALKQEDQQTAPGNTGQSQSGPR